jgi:hypothetical protein
LSINCFTETAAEESAQFTFIFNVLLFYGNLTWTAPVIEFSAGFNPYFRSLTVDPISIPPEKFPLEQTESKNTEESSNFHWSFDEF